MLNTFTDSYDYYFTIRNRIVKNFSAFSFEGLYDIRFDVLNSYAMSLGLDTIQLSMRRWDSYLESVKTIWAATSKCVVAKERRFIFLLFENGEYLILNKKDFKEISSAHQKRDQWSAYNFL